MARVGGFTLVEMLATITIMALASALGGNLIVQTIKSYRLTQTRTELTHTALGAYDFMSRQLQLAAPGSARVSAAGECLEFMPVVAATRYEGELPDAANARSAAANITVLPFAANPGSVAHAVVAGFGPAEIYATATPAARAPVSAAAGRAVTLATAHVFARNSAQKRLYLTADPLRFCLRATGLWQHRDYGFDPGSLTSADPGGSASLIAARVQSAGAAFALSAGSDERRAGVDIQLTFSAGSESLVLNRRVLIRNVP